MSLAVKSPGPLGVSSMSSDSDFSQAIRHFDQYGYCLFPKLMAESAVDALAKRCLALHEDPGNRRYIAGVRPYETLFGMLNLEPLVWTYAAHPAALAIARHVLGPQARVAEVCSKPTWPDSSLPLNLHVDSAHLFHTITNTSWMVNSMWMLTDFTAENGATGVVPMSHLTRRGQPYADITREHELLIPVCGAKGSLFMWNAGIFHSARPNCTDAVRIGLNISYYPPWFNIYSEGGHQPVWPETYARMPTAMQTLISQRRGHDRSEVYEQP
jgi:hypothetical protein